MPPKSPRTTLTALATALKRRPFLWAAVAVAAVVVVVLSLVLAGRARTGPEATAGRVLGGVAAAQEASKDRSGRYASLWLKGNDRTLFERGKRSRRTAPRMSGASSAGRAGWPRHGWRARSTCGAVRRTRCPRDAGGVPLPDCISTEARDALLADLGNGRAFPAPAAAALAAPAKDPGYRPAYHLTPRTSAG